MPEDYPANRGPDLSISGTDRPPEAPHDRPPWRSVGVGIVGIGTPTTVAALHPLLGGILAVIEIVVVLTIFGTALFGSEALSQRAFRLLRWIGNKPEPPAPTASIGGDGPNHPD